MEGGPWRAQRICQKQGVGPGSRRQAGGGKVCGGRFLDSAGFSEAVAAQGEEYRQLLHRREGPEVAIHLDIVLGHREGERSHASKRTLRGGNRACLALARKLLKRSYHILKGLGDQAIASVATCASLRNCTVTDLAPSVVVSTPAAVVAYVVTRG